MDKSNMEKVADGIYLVRTEAGFRKAIRAEFSEIYGEWKWMAKNRMSGHPKSYPSLVSLSIGYNGDTCFQCNSIHFNVLKNALNEENNNG